MEAEAFEAAALQADPSGGVILQCRVTVGSILEVDGSRREILCNLRGVLSEAGRQGYEAVLFRDISDTPSGLYGADDHLAVFDGAAIEILGSFDAEDCAMAQAYPVARDFLHDPFAEQDDVAEPDLAA